MKKILFPAVLAFLSFQVKAQNIFAITGKQSPQIIFNDLRLLDTKIGTSGEILFSVDSVPNVFSQTLQSSFKESKESVHNSQTPSMASLAFDRKTNSLFFVPMFSSDVYVMNNRTKQITLVENSAVKSTSCSVESHLTRMTATKDGNIYAMSNSGSQLIKISTEKGRYSVQDLGKITDISTNREMSISKMLTGFGGDMIADAQNNLYVFSASNNVFKINIGNLTSEYIGSVTGLPTNYSINGSAVNSAGNVVVGSATGKGLYEIDFKNFEARQIAGNFQMPVYDLASSYFLNDKIVADQNEMYAGISIFPTKINEHFFSIKINNENVKGNLKVEMIDLLGNKILRQNINVLQNNSEFKINFNRSSVGVHVINIIDESGKIIFNEKILVEK